MEQTKFEYAREKVSELVVMRKVAHSGALDGLDLGWISARYLAVL